MKKYLFLLGFSFTICFSNAQTTLHRPVNNPTLLTKPVTNKIATKTQDKKTRSLLNPFFAVHTVPDICSTDTCYVNIGYNAGSVIQLQHMYTGPLASGHYDSTMFIPDGPSCSSLYAESSITFNQFAPGENVTDSTDLLSICVDIEHSFSGDLSFKLICPNGQSVVLDSNDHSGGSFLGIPNETDGTNLCDPATNPLGIGWVYGWSQLFSQQGRLNVLDAGLSPVPAVDTINHTNYFTPDKPFSGLIGCPLNGSWSLKIYDNWGIDNGWMFWWELNFDPSFLPGGPPDMIPIDTVIWSGPSITIINDSNIMITPTAGGVFQYTVTLIDSLGNTYDTTFSINVIQTPLVDLGPDTTLCVGTLLDAGPGEFYSWSTGDATEYSAINASDFYWVTVTNIGSSGLLQCKASDTVYINIVSCTGFEEFSAAEKQWKIYPNPVSANITIENLIPGSSTDATVSICDIQNKILIEQALQQGKTNIDINHLTNGIYFIKLCTADGIAVQKFIKETLLTD